MRILCLGTGDAFGSGGRNQTCFHLTTGRGRHLLDCGATSLVAMKAAGIDPNTIDSVLITHLHGDHIGGLPFLILDGQFHGRTEPLRVVGPPGIAGRLHALMEAMYPGSSAKVRRFAVDVVELAERQPMGVADLTVVAHQVVHSSGAPPYGYRIEADGRVLAYTGDTEWTDALLDLARGADLLLCECYSGDRAMRHHLDWPTLAARIPDLQCRRLMVTHMGPEMLARVQDLPVESVYDGLEITI